MVPVTTATMMIGTIPARFTPVTTWSVIYTMMRDITREESQSVRSLRGNVMSLRIVPRTTLQIVRTTTKTRRADPLVCEIPGTYFAVK